MRLRSVTGLATRRSAAADGPGRWLGRVGSVAMLGALAGCVLPPPLPPPPPPLVALPGQGKTQAQFQADDALCRSAADASPPAGQTITVPAAASGQANAPATVQTVQVTPGMVYLRCMADHQNLVQPLAPVRPLYYGFYPAYPIYYGFGDTYPWLYGNYVGFGFGFYGGGFYGGGFRDGFGYRDGFGFRGGEGFRGEEGFRGGGFRGGGRR